jgi:acetyl esterase/lipase
VTTTETGPLTRAELDTINAWWRAANYLSVGQIYLLDNPLLTEPLQPEHVKPRLLGHWGTTPGQNADNPTLSLSRLRAARKLSVPPTLDPRSVSPLKSENLAGLPPTLVVTAALDAIADHGRRYAERLCEDGTDARLTCYPKAVHSFLSIPGLVPAARPARREILAFLRDRLHPALRR